MIVYVRSVLRGHRKIFYPRCWHIRKQLRELSITWLGSALSTSCSHTTRASFDTQVYRLLSASYRAQSLCPLLRSFFKKPSKPCSKVNALERNTVKPVVVYRMFIRLPTIWRKWRTVLAGQWCFPAPIKLAQLCSRILRDGKINGCKKKHGKEVYQVCCTRVIYEISLTCVKAYVGQTGHCNNYRAGDHHCVNCRVCESRLGEIKILGRGHDNMARELLEVFHIRKSGG